MPPSTQDRIIEAAVQLFYEKGFAATSMAEILKRSEANSGSFYYHFKSKEDVLRAVVDWYQRNLHPLLIEPVCARTQDPIERVFALLEFYRQGLVQSDCTSGCPIGRLALEIDPAWLDVHAGLARNFAGWSGAVRKFLEEAGDRLPESVDRAELAQFVLTVMEGAMMQSRSFRSLEPFDASVRQLRAYFRRLEAEAAANSEAESGAKRIRKSRKARKS